MVEGDDLNRRVCWAWIVMNPRKFEGAIPKNLSSLTHRVFTLLSAEPKFSTAKLFCNPRILSIAIYWHAVFRGIGNPRHFRAEIPLIRLHDGRDMLIADTNKMSRSIN